MNKLQQLDRLHRLTKHQEEKAGLQLASIDGLIQSRQQQLQVLKEYRNQDKPQSLATERLPMLYQNYQMFLNKLGLAIQDETVAIESLQTQRLQLVKNYQNIALRRKLIEQWHAKLQRKHRQQLDSQEQLQLEEIMEGVRKWVQTLC